MVLSKDPTDNVFLPINNIYQYTVFLEENKEEILDLIDSIPMIFSKNEDQGNIFKESLKISLDIVRPMGGKLIIIQANDEFTDDIDRETASRLTSSNSFYNMCKDLTSNHVSISIFCFSKCFKVIFFKKNN